MGSPEAGVIDCSVGTIVWVRRRNGSWWPGKILGPDELSASHLMSPRSGTPVKLLGREDASVDWYNLEKSKRVKAFRCGEFDDCIERAESSQGMPVKKREKYARREDAILHALELERQMLEKKHGKLSMVSDCKSRKASDTGKKDLVTSSESLGNENETFVNSKSLQISKKLDLSLKDNNMGSSPHVKKAEEGNQLSGEDDNSEVIPRMRGLQDFGLRIAPSKRQLSSSTLSNGSRKPTVDNHAHIFSSADLNMGSPNHGNRKRPHEGLTEESLVKRRDRRRTLVQVLQSSAKLPASHSLQPDNGTVSTSMSGEGQTGGTICRAKRSRCVYFPAESSDCLDFKENPPIETVISPSQDGEGNCHPFPGALTEENSYGVIEDDESDSSETDYLGSDTDEEMTALSDAVVPKEAEPISEAQGEHGSLSGDELDETALIGDAPHLHHHGPVSAGGGMSKWQLKGKRNIRSLTKRSMDGTDGRVLNGSISGACTEEKESTLSQRPTAQGLSFYNRNGGFENGLDEADGIENDFKPHKIGYENRGYSLTSTAVAKSRCSIIDWEDIAWEDRPNLKGYWEEMGECLDPVLVGRSHVGGRRKSMLVDVDLKVQASYQKEHVPIVSLMSRLNGKAIIGHPIQIEALEDGSSHSLLSINDDHGNEEFDNDGNTAVPSVWRTARRTANVRVPRPHRSSALDSDDAAEHLPFLEKERILPFKKLHSGSFSRKASFGRKSAPHIPRPPAERKFPRKPPKKVSLSSSQKIRTLSSIPSEKRVGNKLKHNSRSYSMDGLIKPNSGPTTVACIPVKLVFSRLFEGVVRPLSRASGHGDLMNSSTGRNPS